MVLVYIGQITLIPKYEEIILVPCSTEAPPLPAATSPSGFSEVVHVCMHVCARVRAHVCACA